MELDNIFIKKIIINKVRNLENIEIPISNDRKKHLIITGKNGSGKTTLLNAIATYIDHIFYKNYNVAQIKETITSQQKQIDLLSEKTHLETDEIVLKNIYDNLNNLKAHVTQIQNRLNLTTQATVDINNEFLLKEAINDKRFIIDTEQFARTNNQEQVTGPKIIGFRDKSLPSDRLNIFFSQFLTNQRMDMLNNREEDNIDEYERIKSWFSIIEEIFKRIFNDNSLRLKYNNDRKIFEITESKKIPFALDEMSSGYSAYFKIVTELLIRMAIIKQDKYDINGLCLIDEIEPHLHIDLQSKALPILTTLFPNIQFIVTTHSPYVINSISNAIVYDLENKIRIEDPSKYTSEALVNIYFDGNNYSKNLTKTINRYKELSLSKNLSEAEKDELTNLEEYIKNLPQAYANELKSVLTDIKIKKILDD